MERPFCTHKYMELIICQLKISLTNISDRRNGGMERKQLGLRDQDGPQKRSGLACDIDIHCHTWTNMKLALRCDLQEVGK